MELDVYHTLLIGITQMFLGSYVFMLIDFRKPVQLWQRRWIVTAVMIVGSNLVGLLFFQFWKIYYRVAAMTVTFPYILVTLLCSRQRDFRAVFSIATGLFVGCTGTIAALLAEPFLGYDTYYTLVVRTIFFFLMAIVLRRFKTAYKKMLVQLDRGWGVLSIIPVVTFLLMLHIVTTIVPADYPTAMMMAVGLLAVCSSAYYLMYLFFEHIQKETAANNERDMLKLRLSALQSRTESVKAAEQAVRTERHDLRHRLQTVKELVDRGDRAAALDFLEAAQQRLETKKEIHWCRPPVLDAVFSSYFDQARRRGIHVDAKISLADTLPVDEGELAIVLANVLENAIHANMELSPEKREIGCKVMGSPSLMLEVVNPCAGTVLFDEQGLPVAKEQGHGMGVQSVAAFCAKYDAVYQFTQEEDGSFRLRLVL